MIEPLGFDGSKTIVDDYLREVRPLFRPARTYQRTVYRPRDTGEVASAELTDDFGALLREDLVNRLEETREEADREEYDGPLAGVGSNERVLVEEA